MVCVELVLVDDGDVLVCVLELLVELVVLELDVFVAVLVVDVVCVVLVFVVVVVVVVVPAAFTKIFPDITMPWT